MIPCICSNCAPESADFFVAQQPSLTVSNFTERVLREHPPDSYPSLDEQPNNLDQEQPSPHTQIRRSLSDDPLRIDLRLIRLRLQIEANLKRIFDAEYPAGGFYTLHNLFLPEKIWSVCVNYDLFLNGLDFDFIFGSEPLPTAYEVILQVMQAWRGNKRDFFAILDPSDEELAVYNHAKEQLANSQQESQDTNKDLLTPADQANPAVAGKTTTTPNRNKRKMPTKRVRTSKKARGTFQAPAVSSSAPQLGNVQF
ncbi:hypothetical protein DFH28DRAFT_929751 [Melampsora americana]|nr:hypothetical protein DFH28DRAFT_929751 [Melampsora americana]